MSELLVPFSDFFLTLHWAAVFQIIVIDILLGGDNAVVIALACRRLPPRRRLQGILWGTAGAIVLRVVLIAFALVLLELPGLKIAGGLLLFWIGVKLLLPESHPHDSVKAGPSLLAAIQTIILADVVMSLDNVIAIAGAAQNAAEHHQMGLVAFGLLFSVPIIIWGSTLVLKCIDRFPVVVTLGAGLLGWIAGGMLAGDIVFARWLGPVPTPWKWGAEILGAVLVMLIGRLIARRRHAGNRRLA